MNAIETSALTCSFGWRKKSHSRPKPRSPYPEGSVYAYLGPNGAGKTTTIKSLLGLIRPTSGEAKILGHDSARLDPKVFREVGYVSENQKMYEWMTVGQFLAYCRPLYPTWDRKFEIALVKQFALPADRRIKHLSRGMRMKASLVSSLAYRPRLLLLDEPFSGLDPLVRQEFIDGILELTEQERWTVLISSHDLDDVEPLADTIGFLKNGKLLLSESAEDLQARFRKIEITYDTEAAFPEQLPATWLAPKASGRTLHFVETAYTGEAAIKQQISSGTITATPMGLKSIYLTLAKSA